MTQAQIENAALRADDLGPGFFRDNHVLRSHGRFGTFLAHLPKSWKKGYISGFRFIILAGGTQPVNEGDIITFP
jgi:hypothetical protein